MEFEDANDEFQSEEQFWADLDETLSQDCPAHSDIDDVLRSYLTKITESRDKFDEFDYLLGRCAFKLAASDLFDQHAEYIRRQLVHSLLQEDDPDTLLIAASFLLADARGNGTEQTFQILIEEGAFPRLVTLISSHLVDNHETMHRLLMEVLYEMSRIQKISLDDLAHVDDDFVCGLFDIIERVSGDVTDPYHYPVIRVVLVLNEQFMVAAHDPEYSKRTVPLTNKVVKVLSSHGSKYKTFSENIILLLNREDETSLQLLTLKLLYLLFTTPATYEYFYTNDLRVLVDILVRNLLDLPEEAAALRHTYLRVLYPLLEHTQLQQPPHYKRDEIQKLLTVLGGGQVSDVQKEDDSPNHWTHFDAIDETTKRLVKRCKGVSWLFEEIDPPEQTQSPTEETGSAPTSPISPSKPLPPALPAPRKLTKRNSSKGSTLTIGQYLAPQLESARQSSLSMMEVAVQREKPGVITPSRNPSLKHGLRAAIAHSHYKEKEKPPIPKARRSGWGRMRMIERTTTEVEITKANVNQEASTDKPDSTQPSPIDTKSEKVESPSDHKGTDDGHTNEQSPQLPPPAAKPAKKPPPAPKARRWRGKRLKDDDDDSGQPREPGKFDSKLPSIKTTVEDKTSEESPFSPLAEQKTLSPVSSNSAEDGPEGRQLNSVSEALSQAQEQAVRGITETLDGVEIREEIPEEHPERITELPQFKPTRPPRPTLETKPTFKPPSPPARRRTASHAHLNNSDASNTPTESAQEEEQSQPQIEITPPPRAVLAPPNQAPARGVPGPKWELERSPFLSEESDGEEEGTK